MKLRNLPIGIRNFEKLRKENYLYVDKTALIYELATTGSYYFLSRPRRFGKSLLLSTLHAYFEGKRELFEGLAIEKLEQNWIQYPILHLDFYNPFSLLNTFQRNAFGNYWFETGTPSYLVYLLKQHDYNLEQMANVHTTEDVLNSIDATSTNPIPVIYQSGYLTIR